MDRGRKRKEHQNFVTQVDFNGVESELVVCPMDRNWQEYYLDFYEYLIREIEPEVIWVEDDFRLHNHEPLEFGGCYCEHHMKAYNQKLGSNYTREELLDRFFRKEPDEAVKKAILEVNRKCMVDLAEKIGQKVKALGLGTKIGLMSSSHQMHGMEYRDWNGIHNGFAQGGEKINRLHLPLYQEDISMKKYYLMFNHYAFVCRGYLPSECHVLPELENGSFSTYAKDSETLRFQLESALPLEIEGMTYDIFDFTGNGIIDAYEYGEAVAGITDYMTKVADSGYSYQSLSGVTILLDEKNAYNRTIKNSFYDLYPDEFYLGMFLQGNGISARCSKEKNFCDEVIVMSAGSVYNFTDEQLERLFRNNQVILEGGAAMKLIDRGLGHLIGACGYKRYVANRDIHSYEQIEGDTLVHQIPGFRASAFTRTGDYIQIQYEKQPEIKSRVYDYLGNEIGYGMAVAGGHMVVPYELQDYYTDMLHPLRQKIVCDYIDSLEKKFARADYSNVYVYYSRGQEKVLILVNPTHHTLRNMRFKLTGEQLEVIWEIERDGSQKQKSYRMDEDQFIVLDEAFDALTTKTFIIQTT